MGRTRLIGWINATSASRRDFWKIFRRPWFYRSSYKPRFVGYYLLRSLFAIVDATIAIFTAPLGYEPTLNGQFCEWSLRKDLERVKRERELH